MSDALLSAPVAIVADVVAVGLLVAAASRLKNDKRDNSVALMGVMGAFIFAAQMVNFSIPGTGSSGHIVGGVLLAAMLGPWAAFLTLSSVLIIQCLIFADGGLMALRPRQNAFRSVFSAAADNPAQRTAPLHRSDTWR